MKKLFFILLIVILGTSNTFAECASSNISVWPRTNTINSNSIFIIQGYASSQEVIKGLNVKYKIYLKSKNAIVPLKIIKIYEGKYNLTQAIIKPLKELINGEVYSLYIEGLDQYQKEDFYSENFKWTVSNEKDIEPPKWIYKPKYHSKHKINFGCGPETFANFCVCTHDNSPVVIFTKLTEVKTGKISEYFVTPDSTSLRIGHGMCSGEFDFIDGENYKISFSLMDSSGNKNDTLTTQITFISATDNDIEKINKKTICKCPKIEETKAYPIKLILIVSLVMLVIIVTIILMKKKGRH